MKQWKKIVIFSIILVLLIGALVITSYYKNKNAAETDITPTPAVEPVVEVKEADIAKITIENSGGTLEFVPGTGKTESGEEVTEWKLTSPENSFYSQTLIDQKVKEYILMEAEGIVNNSGANLSEYGLDKPSATILLTLKSGEKKKILIGKETAKSETHYAMLEGSGRICIASSANAKAAMVSAMDFLDTSLVLHSFTIAESKKLEFKRASDKADFTAISNNDASADGKTPATWKITSPLALDANATNYTTFLTELTTISASSFVELAPKDLSKYGLDHPSYEFTLTGDKKAVHCILGSSAGSSLLYAYSDYLNAVFKVSTSAMTSIDKPFLELVSSFVAVPSIWTVSGIDIKIDNQTIHCDVKDSQDSKETSDFKVNGQDANVATASDTSYFRTFYQSVISIMIKNLDLTAKPAYQPLITIDYTMTDAGGTGIHLAFVKRDDSTYYVFKDGAYQGYYVDKGDFDSEDTGNEGILPAYRILQDAMKNQVNGVYK